MDTVTLTLTVEETDTLHSLLVLRRHAFVQFCHEQFHHSPALNTYIQELKGLEAKLMQIPLDEYNEVRGE
jgi:hypothetical protein